MADKTEGLPDVSGMLESIMKNPAARSMLASILNTGDGGSEAADAAESPDGGTGAASDAAKTQTEDGAPAQSVGGMPFSMPSHRGRGKGRRDVLLALRPYLGHRRCSSLDRMIRAMELYDILEETRKFKGGAPHV